MGMEDETRDFLVLIANTLALVLMWMMLHVFLGIVLELGFFEGSPEWKHILYYLFFIASLLALGTYLKKKWRHMF